jgi:hypothetical protein
MHAAHRSLHSLCSDYATPHCGRPECLLRSQPYMHAHVPQCTLTCTASKLLHCATLALHT